MLITVKKSSCNPDFLRTIHAWQFFVVFCFVLFCFVFCQVDRVYCANHGWFNTDYPLLYFGQWPLGVRRLLATELSGSFARISAHLSTIACRKSPKPGGCYSSYRFQAPIRPKGFLRSCSRFAGWFILVKSWCWRKVVTVKWLLWSRVTYICVR